MKLIYDLKVGQEIEIAGFSAAFQGKYRVEQIIEQIAVCVAEDKSKLMMPLCVPMPFAVLVKGVKPFTVQPVPVQPAVKPEAKTEEAPAPKSEEKAEAEAKAEAAPAPQVTETRVQEPEEEMPASVMVASSERKTGVIEYYDALHHWGKLSHDRFKKGIFFHINAVEDEELKNQLLMMVPGDEAPTCRVSYSEVPNPRRFRTVCAGMIRIEEAAEGEAEEKAQESEAPAPQEAPEVTMKGYITEYGNEHGRILVGNLDRQFGFALEDVEDVYLKVFLKNHVPTGLLDKLDIQVEFRPEKKWAKQVNWLNKADCTAVEPEELEREVSEIE